MGETSVNVPQKNEAIPTKRRLKSDSYSGFKSFALVPGAGIEPARLAAGDFESPASTNFTTRALGDLR